MLLHPELLVPVELNNTYYGRYGILHRRTKLSLYFAMSIKNPIGAFDQTRSKETMTLVYSAP